MNFSALEIRLRRICDELALVGEQRRQAVGSSNDQLHPRSFVQQRPQHAAQRAEQLADLERRRSSVHLAGLDLGQVEQVVRPARQLSADRRM